MFIYSDGYNIVKNVIGEKYANTVLEYAVSKGGKYTLIPELRNPRSKLIKALPEDVALKLMSELGGQRLIITKECLMTSVALRKRAEQDLKEVGYKDDDIAKVLRHWRNTIKYQAALLASDKIDETRVA